MPSPGEYKTVQARILAYAQEVGWTYVPQDQAERRRGFSFHLDPFREDGERKMMAHQLMNAQTRVRDLDWSHLSMDGVATGTTEDDSNN